MSKSWIIGSDPASDLVVQPPASDRHCRLTLVPGGAILEDLGSASGTFVNRVRITGPILVRRLDRITLGPDLAMPWPPEPVNPGPTILSIGREPDNDLVVNLPTVSGHHARVVWSGRSGEAIIEDLRSSNGTAVGSPDRRVDRASIRSTDTIYLGTATISGEMILARVNPSIARVLTLGGSDQIIGRAPESDRVVDEPSVSSRHARLSRSSAGLILEDLNSSNGTFVNGRKIEGPTRVEPGDVIGLGLAMMRVGPLDGASVSRVARTVVEPIPRSLTAGPMVSTFAEERLPVRSGTILRLAGLLILGPLAALMILGVVGGRFSEAEGVVGLVFGLSLWALGFGLINAAIVERFRPEDRGGGSIAAWIAGLGLLGLGQSLLAWGIVARVAGLRGSGLASIGFLALTSMVGLALGLLIRSIVPRRAEARILLLMVLVASWLFGGGPRTLPRSFPWAGVVAEAFPSRWAFEGLLLLESDRSGSPDLAEPYFPSESARMGPRADVLALVAMLVGVSGLIVGVNRVSRPGP